MPRLGMGMPIVSDVSSAPVVAIDDFVFLNDISGELTPNSTAVRKNLLLQSQTFKTTWTTYNAAVPNDLYTAPDGTLTAQAITDAKADGFLKLVLMNNTDYANLNLAVDVNNLTNWNIGSQSTGNVFLSFDYVAPGWNNEINGVVNPLIIDDINTKSRSSIAEINTVS